MRISHFFIDRPIFAASSPSCSSSWGSSPSRACRWRSSRRSRRPPSTSPASSRRQRRGGGRHRGGAPRAADQRRRAHALHLVQRDGRRALHHLGHVRPRHRPRYRAGAGAEPRRHRAAAPAARRAQHRRHRQQGLARPDDGRAPLLARQDARHAVHLQLRQRAGDRRAVAASTASAPSPCSAAATTPCACGSTRTGCSRWGSRPATS